MSEDNASLSLSAYCMHLSHLYDVRIRIAYDVYPLTPPAVSPPIRYLWNTMYNITTGSALTMAAPINWPYRGKFDVYSFSAYTFTLLLQSIQLDFYTS